MSTAKRIETWLWVLIYLGLVALGLGISVSRNSAPLGGTFIAVGTGLAIAGIVLIYIRSRFKDPVSVIKQESTEPS